MSQDQSLSPKASTDKAHSVNRQERLAGSQLWGSGKLHEDTEGNNSVLKGKFMPRKSHVSHQRPSQETGVWKSHRVFVKKKKKRWCGLTSGESHRIPTFHPPWWDTFLWLSLTAPGLILPIVLQASSTPYHTEACWWRVQQTPSFCNFCFSSETFPSLFPQGLWVSGFVFPWKLGLLLGVAQG